MTAVLNHGMNPGLVSHFVKLLLKYVAQQQNNKTAIDYYNKDQINYCARELGLTLIQIAERDNQQSNRITTEKEFVNTWSVVGFIDEAFDCTQIAWGTHEQYIPIPCSTQDLIESGQIVIPIEGSQIKTLSYEPKGGIFTGYCIPHAETYSLVNYLRIENKYRPSVYYSYLVPDCAKLMTYYSDYSLNQQQLPQQNHVLRSDEITSGYDSVGCLLYFRQQQLRTFWIGTILDNQTAIQQSNEVNATCIQVAISVLACIEWMILNPFQGIIEPEELDSQFIFDYCRPYLGQVFWKEVTDICKIKSDQLKDLLIAPQYIQFSKQQQ